MGCLCYTLPGLTPLVRKGWWWKAQTPKTHSCESLACVRQGDLVSTIGRSSFSCRTQVKANMCACWSGLNSDELSGRSSEADLYLLITPGRAAGNKRISSKGLIKKKKNHILNFMPCFKVSCAGFSRKKQCRDSSNNNLSQSSLMTC